MLGRNMGSDDREEIAGEKPLITVVLPVLNGAKTIRSAILSVLAQSYTCFELLVIDDGSTDSTKEMVREMCDNRIRLLSDGRAAGLATRLNEGVRQAKGKYIARMDADDLSFPDRFAKQVKFLEDHKEIDLLATRAVVFSSELGVIGLLPFQGDHEDIVKCPWRGFPMPHPTWMGRREWFANNPYMVPEAKRSEDQELLLRTHLHSRFACLPEILLAYRQTKFSLPKTFAARASVFCSQRKFFISRHAYWPLSLATWFFMIKVIVDIIAAAPGGQMLYFRRMRSGIVPGVITDQMKRMITEYSQH